VIFDQAEQKLMLRRRQLIGADALVIEHEIVAKRSGKVFALSSRRDHGFGALRLRKHAEQRQAAVLIAFERRARRRICR
jgi:hypothetical protein